MQVLAPRAFDTLSSDAAMSHRPAAAVPPWRSHKPFAGPHRNPAANATTPPLSAPPMSPPLTTQSSAPAALPLTTLRTDTSRDVDLLDMLGEEDWQPSGPPPPLPAVDTASPPGDFKAPYNPLKDEPIDDQAEDDQLGVATATSVPLAVGLPPPSMEPMHVPLPADVVINSVADADDDEWSELTSDDDEDVPRPPPPHVGPAVPCISLGCDNLSAWNCSQKRCSRCCDDKECAFVCTFLP